MGDRWVPAFRQKSTSSSRKLLKSPKTLEMTVLFQCDSIHFISVVIAADHQSNCEQRPPKRALRREPDSDETQAV